MDNVELVEDKRPEGFYGPRASEGLDRHIEILQRPPEVWLSPEDKEAVINFENRLMDGQFTSVDGTRLAVEHTDQPLSKVYDANKYTNNRWEITLDYFLTDRGRAHLFDVGIMAGREADAEALAYLIRKSALDLPKGAVKSLYLASEKYMSDKVAEAVAEGKEIADPVRIVVFDDATKLMSRAKGLFAYRKFLAGVRTSLRDNQNDGLDSPALQAEIVIASRYKKKVNAGAAGIEPDLMHFWQQLQCIGQPRKVILEEALSMTWPLVEKLNLDDDSDTVKRFAVRLDRLRYGVALRQGRFSAISESLDKLFEAESRAPERPDQPPIFTQEEVKQLNEVIFDAEQMQEFLKDFIAQTGLLSEQSESEYQPDRSEWAPDGKWQVPIRDDIDAMGFNGSEGALVVPQSFERSLTEVNPPIGVISGAAHECTHGFQETNMRASPSRLKLGKDLKGNNAVIVREAGAITSERDVQSRLFGQFRADNPHYARALKVLENGGGEVDAIREFYASFMEANPDENPKKAAKTAFTRVKRLARRSGGFNSQPLDYAETALLVSALDRLDPQTRGQILSEGALGIEDMAELHRFGLLESKPKPFPVDDFIGYAANRLKTYLK